MRGSRQAVTSILATVILIAISFAVVSIVAIHYNQISYGHLDCDIQSAQIFAISGDVFWGSVQFINSGQHEIESYSVVIYDGTNKVIVDTVTENISPKGMALNEFEISASLSGNAMLLEIAAHGYGSSAICVQEVEL